MSPASRGMTLTEVLLAGALGVLFLGQVLGFLVPSMRVQLRLSAEADQVRLGSLALEKLATDLRATPAAGVSLLLEDGLVAVALHPQEDVTGDGQRVFAENLQVYSWSGKVFQRQQWRPAGAGPAQLQAAELRPLAARRGSLLVGGVDRLTITPAGPGLTSPLELSLTLGNLTLHQAVSLR